MADETLYTVKTYLGNRVKFELPVGALRAVLVDRGLDEDTLYADADKGKLRLAYADILKWMLIGPSKKNNVSDSDNGWTHSGGGYELTDEDRALMKAEANAIYAELEPDSAIKKKSVFRVHSAGIMKANKTLNGFTLNHIV